MTEDQGVSPIPLPATPPVLVPYVPPPKQPVWPKVIGIISICLSGLHLLCGFMGMVAGSAFQSMMRAMPMVRFPRIPGPTTGPTTQPTTRPSSMPFDDFRPFEMFDIPDWVHYGQMVLLIVGLLMAGLLLWAGISLLQKRRRGRSMHLVYAVLQTLVALVTAAATVAFVSAMFPGAPRFFRGMMRAQSIAVAVMNLLFGLAYPVFLLVWFSRRNIRTQVSEWNARDPRGRHVGR